MGNQQRKLEDRLKWLGGFWDGEGSVTLYHRPAPRSRVGAVVPLLKIVNTNILLMDEVADILRLSELPFHRSSRRDKRPNCKPLHYITIAGFRRCVRVLPALIPHLFGKRGNAEILLQLCQERLVVPTRTPYSLDWLTRAATIRENGRWLIPDRSQTTR